MGSVSLHQRRRSYDWLWRPCTVALVLIGHITLLLVMLRPAPPLDEEAASAGTKGRDAIQVRLIRRKISHASIPTPVQQTWVVNRLAPVIQRTMRVTEKSNNIVAAPPPVPPTPLVLQPAAASTAGGYVAGGRSFQQGLDAADHPFEQHVPGADQPRAPHFAMKDPRDEGAGAFVKLLRHYFPQMVNSHCVDVNTWQGMSLAEQAKHASPSEIKQIATEYGCLEPERFAHMTH
jgi:hypothetical protein